MVAVHVVFILFFFALGSCVGSFLNVVVWRLPRIEQDPNDTTLFGPFLKTIEGLSNPPSHCPKCNKRLMWYDNLPVIGWIKLGGKCRFCRQPISPRYPIVEAITGVIFVVYYVCFFMLQVGPCAAQPLVVPDETMGVFKMMPRPLAIRVDWPMYLLYMAMLGALLAASLIDAELFIIPVEIPWVIAAVGIVVHTIIDKPTLAGSLNAGFTSGALAAGGAVGLIISVALFLRGVIPQSFPDGEPMQDVDETPPPEGKVAQYESKTNPAPPPRDPPKHMTRGELAREMRKEIMFLAPPTVLATVWWLLAKFAFPGAWQTVVGYDWFSGLLGAILGALIGAVVVWITRILGTLAFGRLAMGLGDVHLMFGVGAVIGAGGATVAFFLAPFFGIIIAIWMLLTGTKRELPYGPYLSLATAAVLLFGCPILAWLTPGAMGLMLYVQDLFHGAGAG